MLNSAIRQPLKHIKFFRQPLKHIKKILAPILSSSNNHRQKRTVRSRPIDNSAIDKFTQFFSTHQWDEVLKVDDIDKKVDNFHQTLRSKLDEFCPEKEFKVSVLDRKWMTPELKSLNRRIKWEFFKNRKSKKWQSLSKKCKKKKKYVVRNFYQKFVNELKESDPSKWYSIAKRIGTDPNNKTDGSLVVDCLKGLSDSESAEKVAQHFSQISNEYQPLDTLQLPSYLPACGVLTVDQKTVIDRLLKLKIRKSTQPCDLPSRVRKQFAVQLSVPLTDIINSCLENNHYPDCWKHEWVVPVEKCANPSNLNDLRKISLTSEFSLVFESIIKDWILSDIQGKIDTSQYGNIKASSTEHMIVFLMDKILHLLDNNNNKSAIIATLVDWSSAFDRQDPTLAIKKFLDMGVRESLVPVLVSYLTNRRMQVRFNNCYSGVYMLPGGGAQGTLIGVISYLVQSNDNANCVDSSMRYKFVDDLTVLELLMLSGLVYEYDFKNHVANDIAIDELFINPDDMKSQETLDTIANWTETNKMKLNVEKTQYMVFSRSDTEVATRLSLNGKTIDRTESTKLVGVWLTTWLDWEKNTKEICRKAYARMTMISKLKYVGIPINDLVTIYVLYVRSVLEYCSVLWHSTLTLSQSESIERVQKTSLKIILGQNYCGYENALKECGLESLSQRREDRCLRFGLKCLTHPIYNKKFPVNPNLNGPHNTRNTEHFIVNKAKSESYRMSAIPYIQRKLNHYVRQQKQKL